MSRFITLEVPDNYDFRRKFSSNQIMFCGDDECGYHTIDLRLLVDHMFYDPRHHNLPRQVSGELKAE